jgi:hypothetical protein
MALASLGSWLTQVHTGLALLGRRRDPTATPQKKSTGNSPVLGNSDGTAV